MGKWQKKHESLFEGGLGKMKISRGNIHEYLGVTLDIQSQKNSLLI